MMTPAQEKTTKFLEAVESVGFTNTAKIKSEVERLANNPLIQSFLDELSTSVSSRNLLSNQDLEKFHNHGLSVADIDIGRTKQEIGILTAKNQKLKQRSNRVTQQLESAKRYKEKLETQLYELECQQNINLEENRQLHLASDASKCQFDNASQRNEKSMSIYFQAMRDVNVDISTLCSTTLNANDDAVLMSNADFDQVLQEEDEFTRHLTSYAKKQFTQASSGIEDLSSSVQDELPDLTRSMVDAGHAGQDMETRKRLERAMLGFKNRKLRLILAEASVKQTEAVKSFLDEKMSFFISKTQGLKNIHELQKVKEEADIEARYVLFEVLPKLLEKEGNLERSMLLAGDCRQQLAKQKYLTNKQNKVVELLIQQLSRLLVGWMLMQLETHQHQMLSHRLAQCNTRLGHEVAEVRSRNESLRAANSTLRKPKTPKAVIDNRDAAMLGVYHSL
uniref:HAUS augmin-like complex subunit 3 N-terminal domain-containing protein n=1 Tax=Ciona savignyi TaxID=51511 RepID=H2Z252_CIOSA